MKISVVISTYNGSQYIIDQLQSIANQTMQPDEVLIYDDRSTDSTVSIIESFINENNLNWKCTVNEQNKGWESNFADAIDSASGDIVFTCDQDDIWHQDKIRIMSQIMNNNSFINVLACSYRKFQNIKELPAEAISGQSNGVIHKLEITPKYFTVDFPGCTYAIRKTFFSSIVKYRKSNWAHDALMWRFAMFSDSLYMCEDKLHNWRQHTDSTFAAETNRKKNLKDRIDWVDYANVFNDSIHEYIKDNSVNNFEKKEEALNGFSKWLLHRKKMFVTMNPIQALILLKYMHYYRNFKHYLGDIYNTYFNR